MTDGWRKVFEIRDIATNDIDVEWTSYHIRVGPRRPSYTALNRRLRGQINPNAPDTSTATKMRSGTE